MDEAVWFNHQQNLARLLEDLEVLRKNLDPDHATFQVYRAASESMALVRNTAHHLKNNLPWMLNAYTRYEEARTR